MSEWYEDETNGIRYRAIHKEPSDKSKKGEYYYFIDEWFKVEILPLAAEIHAVARAARSIQRKQTLKTITPKGFRRKKGERRDSDRGWVS